NVASSNLVSRSTTQEHAQHGTEVRVRSLALFLAAVAILVVILSFASLAARNNGYQTCPVGSADINPCQ
ncbi:MAG: hypothetical protein ACRDGI_11505, partial [Candidatus Limnocylindrales bacterium]